MAGQADSLKSILFAPVAVTATYVTGDPLWDALGTISIGVLLIVIAVLVAAEVKDLLIGQSVEPAIQAEMQAFLEEQPEIGEVFSLLTMQFGPDVMVAIKARMLPAASGKDLVAAINRVEAAFRQRFAMTAWLFFKPDMED